MSKETYIRFRCTEQEKAMISAMAFQDGKNISEFILNLISEQKKYYEQVEVFSVVKRMGKEIGRKSLGFYFVDNYGRASVYTTWKDISKRMDEHLSEFKRNTNQTVYAEVNGKKITLSNPFSDWIVLNPKD